MIETGLEVFLKKEHKQYRKLRLGVLCNQASVDKTLRHISERVLEKALKLNVSCFFGPQHGVRGEKQDNMVESDDFVDPITQKKVFSLYGATRIPTDAMLDEIDAFVIDLQDIGTRIYTFMYTMANCLRAAKRTGKKVIVLDRPNPINGQAVEGNVLESGYTSFVGQFPMPVRHGMTMGELAYLFNEEFEINAELEVVKLKNWKRSIYGDDWGRDWVAPSPNIPRLEAALVFPGMVLFEGTNVSEGRGTTMPFEWIGAPFIEPDRLAAAMNKKKLPGAYFRPIFFQPTFHKGKDLVCGGVQVHVTDRKKLNAFRAGLHLLATIVDMNRASFKWKQPPYEYEHDRMPIDLIAGTNRLREGLDRGENINEFDRLAAKQAASWLKIRKQYLLYR